MKTRRHFYTYIVLVLITAIFPVFFHGNSYVMNLLIMSMIWGTVAASWDLILGYAGIFNLGQIAFFAIGAYASGMLSVHLGLSPWFGIIIGGIFGGLFGFLIGLPCLKLKGIYIALMTLAFYEVIGPLIVVGRPVGTGGQQGLYPIPPLTIGNYVFNSSQLAPWYYVAFGIFVVFLFVIFRLVNSHFGLAFTALRDREELAKSLGVNKYVSSLILTAVAAGITGFVGAFYSHYVSVISPRLLGLENFLFLLIMVILGGAANFPGAVIGAFAVTFLNDWLRPLGNFRLLALGGLLVVIIILFPKGIMGAIDTFLKRIKLRKNLKVSKEE